MKTRMVKLSMPDNGSGDWPGLVVEEGASEVLVSHEGSSRRWLITVLIKEPELDVSFGEDY